MLKSRPRRMRKITQKDQELKATVSSASTRVICFSFTHIYCDQEHSAEAKQNQFKVISSFSFILASLFATPPPTNLFHNS